MVSNSNPNQLTYLQDHERVAFPSDRPQVTQELSKNVFVRIREMRQSAKIVLQALGGLFGGPLENLEAKRMAEGPKSKWNGADYQFIGKKIAPTFKIPEGDHYARVKIGRGEMGIFLIGNGNEFPWRWKIRAPDFVNLQILPFLLRGVKVADITVVLGSADIIMGSVDRQV